MQQVDQEGIQYPATIPVALLHDEQRQQLHLIKVREPIITFNDLLTTLSKDKAERYHQAAVETFTNWAKMAEQGLYQIDVIPLNHHAKEMWTQDNGFDGQPGMLTGNLGGPSNLGMLKE